MISEFQIGFHDASFLSSMFLKNSDGCLGFRTATCPKTAVAVSMSLICVRCFAPKSAILESCCHG